jgi:Mrp family chromosome partitioning ATPase
MSNHFEYLAKANRLSELAVPGKSPSPKENTLLSPRPSPLTDSTQWMRLARFLEFGKPGKELASVGVFSAAEDTGEPGSFVISLAVSLGTLHNCTVVILDLDLDGSELAVPLGTPSAPGVGCALQFAPNLRRDCIHETWAEGVHLIPSGMSFPVYQPKEFERRLRWLDEVLAHTYPLIIYRFPRAKQMRAMRSCFQIPQISLLTVTPGLSRKSEVRREAELLKKAGANLAGVVFTEDVRCYRG